MLRTLAEKWADRLIDKGTDPEMKEIVIYGMEAAINEALANIIAYTIAFIIGMPLEMLIWQVFWLALRVNMGGHHANSHMSCLIYSTVVAVVCVLVVPYVLPCHWLILLEIISTLVVAFCLAPFIHPNRCISETHRIKVKKRCRVTAVIESIVIAIFYCTLPIWVAHIAALGMFGATFLCIIGKVCFYFESR